MHECTGHALLVPDGMRLEVGDAAQRDLRDLGDRLSVKNTWWAVTITFGKVTEKQSGRDDSTGGSPADGQGFESRG